MTTYANGYGVTDRGRMVTMIDESEICISYRQAKDKAAQVSILADLYATTPVGIRDILEHNGFIVGNLETNSTGGTRVRKRWTPDMIEDVARLWAEGVTADELAQQFQTTISAIVGLQHRHKKVFEQYMAQPVPELQPGALVEAAAPQEEPMETPQEERTCLLAEPGYRQCKTPTTAGAKLNSIGLLLSHAKALQQTACDALSEGRDIDCAYSLGELSQVLIRAKETSTHT